PTAAERAGEFADDDLLYDPQTGEPFPGNVIPAERIDPSALVLLGFLPPPNQDGTTQNFHYVTSTRSSSDQVSLRLTQLLGAPAPPRNPNAPRGGRPGP